MVNKNNDEFNGVAVKLSGAEIGKLTTYEHANCAREAFDFLTELKRRTYCLDSAKTGSVPTVRVIIKYLIYKDLLDKAMAELFYRRYGHLLTVRERMHFMEKYGVQVDPKKVREHKKDRGEKTAGVDDPEVNVPKDPDKGTEPFEKDED